MTKGLRERESERERKRQRVSEREKERERERKIEREKQKYCQEECNSIYLYIQLKEARKRSAQAVKDKEAFGDIMESLEKKARLAVEKDGFGIKELGPEGTSSSSKKTSRDVEVVNQAIYALKKEAEKEEEKKKDKTTGLGTWESIPTQEEDGEEVDGIGPINPAMKLIAHVIFIINLLIN
eukprot:sb/3471620/